MKKEAGQTMYHKVLEYRKYLVSKPIDNQLLKVRKRWLCRSLGMIYHEAMEIISVEDESRCHVAKHEATAFIDTNTRKINREPLLQ